MAIEIVPACRRRNSAHTSFINTALSVKYLLGVRRAFVFLKACGVSESVAFRILMGGPRRARTLPVRIDNLEEQKNSDEE
jgi:hypothetical protein